MDFSQFSGINSIFSFAGMLVIYFSTEIFKWAKKKKTSNAAKEDIYSAFLRLELLMMMHLSPEQKEIITELYGKYKGIGGNSYIDLQYQRWLKEN